MSVIRIKTTKTTKSDLQSTVDAGSQQSIQAGSSLNAVMWSLIVGIPVLIGAEIWLVERVFVP